MPTLSSESFPEDRDAISNAILASGPSCKIRGISVIGYANGFTSWHYRPEPNLEPRDILAHGFFDQLSTMVAQGDFVVVSGLHFGFTGFFSVPFKGVVEFHLASAITKF